MTVEIVSSSISTKVLDQGLHCDLHVPPLDEFKGKYEIVSLQ